MRPSIVQRRGRKLGSAHAVAGVDPDAGDEAFLGQQSFNGHFGAARSELHAIADFEARVGRLVRFHLLSDFLSCAVRLTCSDAQPSAQVGKTVERSSAAVAWGLAPTLGLSGIAPG
jgi:hypothetical protein